MPSSVTEAANSAVREIFTNGTIDAEDSPTPYDKVILKTVHGTYKTITGKEKLAFAKRAAENGITTTICCFIEIKCVNSLATTYLKKSVRVSVLFNL